MIDCNLDPGMRVISNENMSALFLYIADEYCPLLTSVEELELMEDLKFFPWKKFKHYPMKKVYRAIVRLVHKFRATDDMCKLYA